MPPAVPVGPAERPRLLIEVCWRHLYCAVWVFDPLLRRFRKAELRRLEAERLVLRKQGVRFRNEIVIGVGGKQVLVEDPSGNPVELFEPTLPEASLSPGR
jgi:hypothetical protein